MRDFLSRDWSFSVRRFFQASCGIEEIIREGDQNEQTRSGTRSVD